MRGVKIGVPSLNSINVNVMLKSLSLAVALSLFWVATAFAAPQYSPNPTQQINAVINDVRHEVNNHEIEIRMLEEKLSTLEDIFGSVRKQLSSTQESSRSHSTGLEKQFITLESTVKGLVSDMRKLQTHANDSAKALTACTNKVGQLEKNLDNLQTAMQSILAALGGEELQYQVRPGDSLGKIAQDHHTTIRELKKLNGLTSDRIHVGQSLKLPRPS